VTRETALLRVVPVLLTQIVNGSLITTVLRLRAARRELAANPDQEQDQVDAVDQAAEARLQLVTAAA
jgi:CDP-diacylglycerol---glycerol-3-phosphate 3-phosphatidyltransferase